MAIEINELHNHVGGGGGKKQVCVLFTTSESLLMSMYSAVSLLSLPVFLMTSVLELMPSSTLRYYSVQQWTCGSLVVVLQLLHALTACCWRATGWGPQSGCLFVTLFFGLEFYFLFFPAFFVMYVENNVFTFLLFLCFFCCVFYINHDSMTPL